MPLSPTPFKKKNKKKHCEYVILLDTRDFACVIKLRILEWEDYLELWGDRAVYSQGSL